MGLSFSSDSKDGEAPNLMSLGEDRRLVEYGVVSVMVTLETTREQIMEKKRLLDKAMMERDEKVSARVD